MSASNYGERMDTENIETTAEQWGLRYPDGKVFVMRNAADARDALGNGFNDGAVLAYRRVTTIVRVETWRNVP